MLIFFRFHRILGNSSEKGRIVIETIIFLGTKKSGSSRDALKAAEKLGYFTVLFTNNPKQVFDRNSFPEIHIMQYCDLDDIDAVRESIRHLRHGSLNIKAIVSFIDPYCSLAARLAKEFGVERFSFEAMEKMENKLKTRETLRETPYNPEYLVIKEGEENERAIKRLLPAVLKYTDSNGSKDVYYCEDFGDYLRNSRNLFKQHPGKTFLLEEYLEGEQFIVEVLVEEDDVKIAAVVEQEIEYVNKHFIVTGYNLLINYSRSYFERLKNCTEEIVKHFGLKNGPCHLEIRLTPSGWKLIEINPRISGAGMNQLIQIGFGINLVAETLKLAVGEKPDLEPKHYKHAFAQYLILEKSGVLERITGRGEVLSSPGVEFVYIKPRKGAYLTPPNSLGNRYAFVIATGGSEKDARRNAKSAADKIVFHLITE